MGSSAEARGGDHAGCCTEVDVDMFDVCLDGENEGLDGTRLVLQRRMVLSICLRRSVGFDGLGRMEII